MRKKEKAGKMVAAGGANKLSGNRPRKEYEGLDPQEITERLRALKEKTKELTALGPDDIGEDEVAAAREMAESLQDINRQFKEALKRAMMADGKIKPGQTITAGGRYVRLVPRPGCPEGSTDPDHYDLTYENIH